MVTVVGLPFGIGVFIWEQRRERQNEDEEIYQRLSDEYAEFSKLLLENADLRLTTQHPDKVQLNDEQRERKAILFDMLVSLFERAFILVYEEDMSDQSKRLWASWEDYIRFWCNREDFRRALPNLLKDEDPDFVAHMNRVTEQVVRDLGR